MSDLRERIAKAIHKQGGYCGLCDYEGEWDSCPDCRKTLLGYADAVLDALGLQQVGWWNGTGFCYDAHDDTHTHGRDWHPAYRLGGSHE